jgi:hypothetical protein
MVSVPGVIVAPIINFALDPVQTVSLAGFEVMVGIPAARAPIKLNIKLQNSNPDK